MTRNDHLDSESSVKYVIRLAFSSFLIVVVKLQELLRVTPHLVSSMGKSRDLPGKSRQFHLCFPIKGSIIN